VGAATSDADYAGDLECSAAWDLLTDDRTAQLADVRTIAEWNFVGLPDLGSIGRRPLTVEWQSYPSMAVNPDFVAQASELLAGEGAKQDTPVLCLCRSGARSRAAAIALTKAGYTRVYNVAGGFEGDLDAEGHRAKRNGWKQAGLPWRQS
jgi:rhodanese-related sulfurtransferase